MIVARISDGEALVGARGRRLLVLARGLVFFEVHSSPSISAAFRTCQWPLNAEV